MASTVPRKMKIHQAHNKRLSSRLTQSATIQDNPTNSLAGIRFCGTGSFAPQNIVPNESLARLGCDEEWIVQRTGIRERRHAPSDMSTSDMAYEAGKQCLEQAGVDSADVDLLILSTMTPDYFAPSTSCLVQKKLGLRSACLDLNAACAGFLYGLITGAQFIHSGCSRNVLVVGADVMSRVANPDDVKTYPLFGDGAGAVLLGRDESSTASLQPGESGILSYTLGADGDTEGWLKIPGGGYREPLTPESLAAKHNFLVMDGKPVFKWAVRTVADAILEVMRLAKVTPDDLSLVVLHQANIRIIEAAVANLGFDPDQVFVNLERYGNTSAGSVPLALDEANRAGRLQPGEKVLLCGFGAGLTWGACVVRW